MARIAPFIPKWNEPSCVLFFAIAERHRSLAAGTHFHAHAGVEAYLLTVGMRSGVASGNGAPPTL